LLKLFEVFYGAGVLDSELRGHDNNTWGWNGIPGNCTWMKFVDTNRSEHTACREEFRIFILNTKIKKYHTVIESCKQRGWRI